MPSFGNLDDLFSHIEKQASGDATFSELFNPEFMEEFTDHKNINDLFSSGGFVVKSEEDFKNLDEGDVDKHIQATTRFSSWKEMMKTAGQLLIKKRLGL